MFEASIFLFTCCLVAVTAQTQYSPTGPQQAEDISLSERQFRVVYEWRTVDFAYKTEAERGSARQQGKFIDKNVLISDAKAFANRLYFTMPRMLPGVPATLGWVVAPDNNGRSDPLIEPFPSWELNAEGDCFALQFVQGIAIDADGVLWAVDSGRLNTLEQPDNTFSCPPKIVLFDLKNNGTELQRYEFPDGVVMRRANYLNKIVVDDADGGYAYITDNSQSDPGIVVYSRKLNQSWKVRDDRSMRADQNAMMFTVNGTNLRFSIHIDGIALGPYYNPRTSESSSVPYNPRMTNENYERNVYFSPLSSYHLFSIPASMLRNPSTSTLQSPNYEIIDHGLKSSQTDGMTMDNRGILYYGLLKDHAIAQWDSFQPFTPNNQHIIAKDDHFIQWTDGMTFDERGYLYVVINRLHNFVARRLNPNEVNFRVLRAKTGGMSYVFTNNGPGAGNVGINLLPQDANFPGGISSTPSAFNSYDPNLSGASSRDIFTILNLLFIGIVVHLLR